jgi:hypothetical protein
MGGVRSGNLSTYPKVRSKGCGSIGDNVTSQYITLAGEVVSNVLL